MRGKGYFSLRVLFVGGESGLEHVVEGDLGGLRAFYGSGEGLILV